MNCGQKNIDLFLCSVEQLSPGVEEMAVKISNLEEEEAAWPSGQRVRLTIQRSQIWDPHLPLAGFVLRDQMFVFSGESPWKQEFPPRFSDCQFYCSVHKCQQDKDWLQQQMLGEEGFLGGSMNILGSKLQNMSIHVLRRKLCRCLHFTIVFAIMSVSVAFSTHLCMISHYFTCVMSLFQSYVTCWSSSLLPL